MGSRLTAAPSLTMWTAAWMALVLVASPLVQAAPAEVTAKDRVARGLEFYQAGNYDKAIAEFDAAYAASGSAAILFPWAQAERLRGNCSEAITLYQRFIDSGPAAKQVEAATKSRKDCEDRLKSTDAVAAKIVPGEAGTTTTLAPSPAQEPSAPEGGPGGESGGDPASSSSSSAAAPRRSDTLGWVLLGGGAGGVVVGSVLLGVAAGAEAKAADAPTYGDFADTKTRASQERIAGGVVLGVGVALVLGGILRLVLSSRGRSGAKARLNPHGLGLEGRF